MNMKKLAEFAGVSVSTVSKAFSYSSEISEEKRKYIFEVAKKTGCYDKYCKQVFNKPVIAVVCPEFESGYYSQQLYFFEREIKKQGGIMVVSSANFDNMHKTELVSYFTEILKADGIIIYGYNETETKYSVPVIVIGESDSFGSVCLSSVKAMNEAIKTFIHSGRKNIAFIGENLTTAKQSIFVDAMNHNGIKVKDEYIVKSEKRFQAAGYDAMNTLFEQVNPPDAVIAAYDEIAIGAMRSIYEHGKKIPEDISIIGMDDIRTAPYLDVSLSSITSYNEDFCQIVTDMLFENIKHPGSHKPRKIKVSSELIIRDSIIKKEP